MKTANVTMRVEGLDQTTVFLGSVPDSLARARVSALKSTGWMISREIRNAYEHTPRGRHSLSRSFHENWKTGKWEQGGTSEGLAWFGRFARYSVSSAGTEAVIGLGRAARGRKRQAAVTMDAGLESKVRKHEFGKRFQVTERMRRKYAATKRVAGWQRGKKFSGQYVSLRKGTRSIYVPPRPVWGPVRSFMKFKATMWFNERFAKAVNRYAGKPRGRK